ncbi:hypothetical protein J2Z62_000797 [Mycoplasmoides fastidiosum]|uniref:Uncharacterized protein n=1 Tax=Mycoplasmoides fastidiosum TaxID=92758 RepID=A0ABU0M078_9BACT|nr:hypothetical protein [Mycoplasmoides fastidiosum]MDQ0514359.1 hypothetical protein [Mycoplasmoides fastidiosum]
MFLGRDLADIKNIIIKTDTKLIPFLGNLAKTGIWAVTTAVSLNKNNQTSTANAYNDLDLKYVQYNKQTKIYTDVRFALFPSLFRLDQEQNNCFALTEIDSFLTKFLSTQTIPTVVANILEKSVDGSVFKNKWCAACKKLRVFQGLFNHALSLIIKIFNPNLNWGLGIYDLSPTANIFSEIIAGSNLKIGYQHSNRINVTGDIITYLPNRNYKNFSALKTMHTSGSVIHVIGNQNTFNNNHYSIEASTDTELQNSNQQFWRIHWPWTLIILIVLVMALDYAIWHYQYTIDSVKFMQEERNNICSCLTQLRLTNVRKAVVHD